MGKRAIRRREEVNAEAEARILAWFQAINLTVPEPALMAMAYVGKDFVEVPVPDFADDDEEDDWDGIVFTPDVPNLEDLAAGCVGMLREAEWRPPPRWSPLYWRWLGRVWSKLYTLGVISGGHSYEMRGDHGCTRTIIHPPWRYGWRHMLTGKRSYVLGKQRWYWECIGRQGLHLRGRHWPEQPFAFGVCASCCPCPECGAHQECLPTCALTYG